MPQQADCRLFIHKRRAFFFFLSGDSEKKFTENLLARYFLTMINMKIGLKKGLFFAILYLGHLLPLAALEKTICLNMIVKNESRVIERCLRSVKPLIDYWVIVDTGSSDGTQQIIKEFLSDIPGELFERPWVDFAHNRNEALRFAKNKGDYILTIDADEELIYDKDFVKPQLDRDFYFFIVHLSERQIKRVLLVNNYLNWEWVGVLHEYLSSKEAKSCAIIKGILNLSRCEGCRSQDPGCFQKDVEILEKALLKEPDNARYVYYLAQSYLGAQNPPQALKFYEKRIKMGEKDNPEEYFSSLYNKAVLQQYFLKQNPQTFIESYFKAYHSRPSRAEPLYHIGQYYRIKENYFLGYLLLKYALSLSFPDDGFPIETWIYEHGLLLEFSLCSYYTGRYQECKEASDRLLANPKLPQEVRDLVLKNLEWVYPKLPPSKQHLIQEASLP